MCFNVFLWEQPRRRSKKVRNEDENEKETSPKHLGGFWDVWARERSTKSSLSEVFSLAEGGKSFLVLVFVVVLHSRREEDANFLGSCECKAMARWSFPSAQNIPTSLVPGNVPSPELRYSDWLFAVDFPQTNFHPADDAEMPSVLTHSGRFRVVTRQKIKKMEMKVALMSLEWGRKRVKFMLKYERGIIPTRIVEMLSQLSFHFLILIWRRDPTLLHVTRCKCRFEDYSDVSLHVVLQRHGNL